MAHVQFTVLIMVTDLPSHVLDFRQKQLVIYLAVGSLTRSSDSKASVYRVSLTPAPCSPLHRVQKSCCAQLRLPSYDWIIAVQGRGLTNCTVRNEGQTGSTFFKFWNNFIVITRKCYDNNKEIMNSLSVSSQNNFPCVLEIADLWNKLSWDQATIHFLFSLELV